MNIRFVCSSCNCDFIKTDKQLSEEKQSMRFCPYCGCKLRLQNLDEIVKGDILKKVDKNIEEYLNSLGIEGTIELIERNKSLPYIHYFQDNLRKRGIIK